MADRNTGVSADGEKESEFAGRILKSSGMTPCLFQNHKDVMMSEEENKKSPRKVAFGGAIYTVCGIEVDAISIN
jgi:hypothetical protein